MAECYEVTQSHILFRCAAVRLASRTRRIDSPALRSMVTGIMGGVEGTYWVVAALTMAQLALSFPELLTEAQASLLLAPLVAAESLVGQPALLAEVA
ncbi:hypothetical protein [Arthrobacter sp. CAN_C5]|uniref:hypothetical protein n=1 Tax=Arthrobacter sp. CAN_C5 TaxID=2760706 RepID=UPI001AE90D75|nr:hypothetical protein [Arthrobacter sp. CAN_C5]MBP2216960.1 hypothetical protein [Arthrobacter sp. CAN_C5]